MRLTTINEEILRSDILRVTILMGFFLFLAAYAALWAIASPDQFNVIFENAVSSWTPSGLLIAIAFYYFLMRCFLMVL